jgi:hypothetical protein
MGELGPGDIQVSLTVVVVTTTVELNFGAVGLLTASGAAALISADGAAPSTVTTMQANELATSMNNIATITKRNDFI